jgi:chaperonin cofactor prefoldin
MTTELENTTDMTRPENTTYSGMRGNIITFLTERQDQLCEQLNTKIERLDQRLILLEDQEQKRGRP